MMKPSLNIAVVTALIAGMTMLAGCGSDSSHSMTTSEQVAPAPAPMMSESTTTTIRRQ